MSRAWVCVAACVVAAVGVAGQQGGIDSNIRLGLLAEQLGVDPVPGGNPNLGNIGVAQREDLECHCIPINQECPFDLRGRPTGIVTRISNTRPLKDGQCEVDTIRCCRLKDVTDPGPGGPFPGRCGGRQQIPNYLQGVPPQADFGEYPWMAVVLDASNNGYLGGGVLIRNQWVLTAAHKITTRNIRIRLGDYDLKRTLDHPDFPHLEVGVRNIIIHPNFDSKSLVNDVALLELDRPVNTNQYPHIGLACLPNQAQKFEGQNRCFVSGWGKDTFTNGQFQSILKEVDVPILERFTCQSRLRKTRLGEEFVLDANSFVCAGGIEGKDACSGDGGSPLVCPTNNGYTVVGLVAWGIGCAQGDVPGVYVNVANFVNFIEGYVGPL